MEGGGGAKGCDIRTLGLFSKTTPSEKITRGTAAHTSPPSLSGVATPALPLAPSRCETRHQSTRRPTVSLIPTLFGDFGKAPPFAASRRRGKMKARRILGALCLLDGLVTFGDARVDQIPPWYTLLRRQTILLREVHRTRCLLPTPYVRRRFRVFLSTIPRYPQGHFRMHFLRAPLTIRRRQALCANFQANLLRSRRHLACSTKS